MLTTRKLLVIFPALLMLGYIYRFIAEEYEIVRRHGVQLTEVASYYNPQTATKSESVVVNILEIDEADISVLHALKLSAKNEYCGVRKDAALRYKGLKQAVAGKTILIAVNFYNNQEQAPDFILQLWDLISFIGYDHCFVSIYENGSKDQTKTFLSLLELLLKDLGVAHEIILGMEEKPESVHRIEYLAAVRNRAIKPLANLGDAVLRVLFMNDVIFCADDMKELLYQSLLNQADITCGIDYDTDKDGVGFYDTWVGRDVKGRVMKKRPLDSFTANPKSNEKLRARLPFQVGCCWNGAAVLNPAPFLAPHNIEFRRRETKILESNDPRAHDLRVKFGEARLYEQCSASEMNNMCKDFRIAGFSKAIMVPRVRIAYDWPTYHKLRKLYPIDEPFSRREQDEVEFKSLSKTSVCMPMNGIGLRSPDGETGEELIMP